MKLNIQKMDIKNKSTISFQKYYTRFLEFSKFYEGFMDISGCF